jgi:hypothetical protein
LPFCAAWTGMAIKQIETSAIIKCPSFFISHSSIYVWAKRN